MHCSVPIERCRVVASQSARRLLFVDDDQTFAQIAARALTRRGFDVTVAHDLASALDLAHSDTDYAVVDLMLGEASGLDLLSPFKAINPAMRILVVSGFATIETVMEAIRRGATRFLAKPLDADTIAAALRDDRCNSLVSQ
jgi:two-component system, response regulator RegA